MCGIVGVVYGPNGPKAEKLTPSESAKSMFPNVEHRGKDAFGWIHHRPSGSIQLRKFAENASAGLEKLDPSHRFGIPNDAKWWIGHVRLATHGSKDYTHNNHPIVHGDIMGVHNGICYNYNTVLRETGRQHKKAEVDSEAIFAAIDHYGIFKGLDKLDALAAVVFVDRKTPNVVHLATCDANPLIVATSKGGATYFASESWILEELGIEWAEEPWRMSDYTYLTIEDGVQGDYLQWADPKEKEKQGWGAYTSSYSSYNGGGTSYIGQSSGYTEWEYDDMNGEWYDSTTGRMGSHATALTEDMVECLSCDWQGTEISCYSGECPQCGSFAYLVPRGVVSEGTRQAVQMEIDASEAFGDNPQPWVYDYLSKARRSKAHTDYDYVAVGRNGVCRPVDRKQDDQSVITKIFERSEA